MGNCQCKKNNKRVANNLEEQNNKKTTKNTSKNTIYKLCDTQQICDAIMETYIQKKNIGGALLMKRNNKTHISLSIDSSDDKENSYIESNSIIILLEDFFANLEVNYKIYINDKTDKNSPNYHPDAVNNNQPIYKLYCHIE